MRMKIYRLRVGLEPNWLDVVQGVCKSRVWNETERLQAKDYRNHDGSTVYTMPPKPTFHLLLHRATNPHDASAYGEMSYETRLKEWTGDEVFWQEDLAWHKENCACVADREPELWLLQYL